MRAAEAGDRLVDHGAVGAHVVLFRDQSRSSGGSGTGGAGADFLDRRALGGGDLVLGHASAAIYEGTRIRFRLLNDRIGLDASAVEDRLCLGSGPGGLGRWTLKQVQGDGFSVALARFR